MLDKGQKKPIQCASRLKKPIRIIIDRELHSTQMRYKLKLKIQKVKQEILFTDCSSGGFLPLPFSLLLREKKTLNVKSTLP